MLHYSFPCSCSKNLSSFRFIIKQQWTIEEISIFSNSSHLKWRAGLSITNLKGTHPRTISARFGLFWFRGFREEDLNVKVYDIRRTDERTTMDAKWWQKLTWSLARWANKTDRHDIVESGINTIDQTIKMLMLKTGSLFTWLQFIHLISNDHLQCM
jgi:hypothetical protein